MSATVVALKFENRSVRMVERKDDLWFVLADVCAVLEIADAWNAGARLDDDEKGTAIVSTPGGPQEMMIISEPGLYKLLGTSRKPEAKRFDRWVRHEVLPEIRRTGSYNGGASPDVTAITNAILQHVIGRLEQPMLTGFKDVVGRLDLVNAALNSKRKEISDAVKHVHVRACHRFGGQCPCCSINRVTNPDGSKAPFAEFDHMQHKSAPTVEDTWLICASCHRKVTYGEMLRAECAPSFDLYQSRLSYYAAAQKPPPLVLISECETGPPSCDMKRQGRLDL